MSKTVFADRELRNTIKIDQKSHTEWYHIRANLEKPLYRNSENSQMPSDQKSKNFAMQPQKRRRMLVIKSVVQRKQKQQHHDGSTSSSNKQLK